MCCPHYLSILYSYTTDTAHRGCSTASSPLNSNKVEERREDRNTNNIVVSFTIMSESSSSFFMKHQNLFLLVVYCTCTAAGSIGTPFLGRLYFLNGGSLQWFTSFLQSIGFFFLLPPLAYLYLKSKLSSRLFFMDLNLFFFSVAIGVLNGFVNYLSSIGLSYLPVSTTSLLFATQLAFTALAAFVIVKQKFTFYSLNSVLVITFGALVLGLQTSGDRPLGVTKEKYLLGFFCVLAASALGGVSMPLIELAYSKSSKPIEFPMLLQVQAAVNASAALFCTVGMLIRKDFQKISVEAKNFTLGEHKYYLIVVAVAIISQLTYLGVVGMIKCKSSLFVGIFNSGILPVIEVASVITFHEKFGGGKILSLGLCLWGFTSYFIGESKKDRESKNISENTIKHSVDDGRIDLEGQNQVEMN